MRKKDTIAAFATPLGRCGIGILRISGPLTRKIATSLLGKVPEPRLAEYLPFKSNGITLDYGIALFFPNPNSLTGEDVLELQGHGNPVILDELLQKILKQKEVRIAQPGEFLERSFLNGKIDLIQAESISDLINADSIEAAQSAISSLQGTFSEKVHSIIRKIINLRIQVESEINFSEEEIQSISLSKIEDNLDKIINETKKILKFSNKSHFLQEGTKIVIIGEPNVGKSSLLNALVGEKIAIVTPIAGTTRDILKSKIYLNGIPTYLSDTAGLRKTEEKIEKIGIRLAEKEIKKSNHILLVVDARTNNMSLPKEIYSNFIKLHSASKIPITIVRNKSDLTNEPIGKEKVNGLCCITLSTKTGKGLEILRKHLMDSTKSIGTEGKFISRRRHIQSLKETYFFLERARNTLSKFCSLEILAEELKSAQNSLGELIGKFTSEDLLKKIFSKFCIGK